MVTKAMVQKLRVPREADMVTKAMMMAQAKGEMSPHKRVMAMEPLVQAMAAAKGERELTAGEGWRRRQHHHQERDE